MVKRTSDPTRRVLTAIVVILLGWTPALSGCETPVERAWRPHLGSRVSDGRAIHTWVVARFRGIEPAQSGLIVPILDSDASLKLDDILGRSAFYRSQDELESFFSSYSVDIDSLVAEWPCSVDKDVDACLATIDVNVEAASIDAAQAESTREWAIENRIWNVQASCGDAWFVFPVINDKERPGWRYRFLWFRSTAELDAFAHSGHRVLR